MRRGQDRKHAQRLVELDEAHAAHIATKVEYVIGALLTGLKQGEIKVKILDVVKNLIPFADRFAIDGANTSSRNVLSKCPPMNPPPAVTGTRSSFCIGIFDKP